MENINHDVLISILGVLIANFLAVLGWVFSIFFASWKWRNNIRGYLTALIPLKISEVNRNYGILLKELENDIQLNQPIKIIPLVYDGDDLEAFFCVKHKVIEYLTDVEVRKFTYFLFVLREIDDCYRGFCIHLNECKNKKTVIDEEIYNHLHKHLEDAASLLINLPSAETVKTGLNDLPSFTNLINGE